MGRWQTPRSANWRRNSFEAWKRKEFGDAKGYLETALEIAGSFGQKDLRFALTLNDFAYLYRSTGNGVDQIEAAKFVKRAGEIFEQLRLSAPWRPLTNELRAISAMAALYRDQHDADDGSQKFRPDVVESLEYAAKVVSTDAREVLLRALAVREKALGAEHLLVAESLETLAANTHPDEFENVPLERALKIREKVQGPDHPDVANTIEAQVHEGFVEAVSAYERVLAIREKAWGPEHPDLVPTLKNLSLSHQALARISQTHLGGVSSGADEPGCGSICVALRQSGPGLIV